MLVVTPGRRCGLGASRSARPACGEAYNRFVRRRIWIDPHHCWQIPATAGSAPPRCRGCCSPLRGLQTERFDAAALLRLLDPRARPTTMKLLQITYYFPPMGGAGVQRSLKFSEVPAEFGITPVVLAARRPGLHGRRALLAELPPAWPCTALNTAALLQRRRLAGVAPRRAGGAWPQRQRWWPFCSATRPLRTGATARWPPTPALQFPDDKAGWARRALRAGDAADPHRRSASMLILSTAPPMSTHGSPCRARTRQRPALGSRLPRPVDRQPGLTSRRPGAARLDRRSRSALAGQRRRHGHGYSDAGTQMFATRVWARADRWH